MADNNRTFKCSGNCLDCPPAQRAYCASQHAYSNMKVLDNMMGVLSRMQEDMAALQGAVGDMAAKIEAIQSGEASVFNPASCEEGRDGFMPEPLAQESFDGQTDAQEGDGA